MPLQRALVGLGESNGFTRGGFTAVEVIELLEDLSQEYIAGYELADAGLQLLFDHQLLFGVYLGLEKVLFPECEVGENVFDGRRRLADQLVVLGQDVVGAPQGLASRRKVTLCELYQRKTDQSLLQLDFLQARIFLADLQGTLPGLRGIGIAALPLVYPGIGDMYVRDFRGLRAVLTLQNRLRELQQRHRFCEQIHVRDHGHGQRAHPPRELGGLVPVFPRHPRNGHAQNGDRGRRIGFRFRFDFLA